jgi:hypothetical protein
VKARILSSRRVRRCLGAVACVAVGLIAAVMNTDGMSVIPLSLHRHSLEIAGASTQAIVDNPGGTELQQGAQSGLLNFLTARSVLLGEMMSSRPVASEIAHQAGIPPSQLSVSTSYVQNWPENFIWPDLEVRANQIVEARAPYQLNIQPDPALPRLEIYARAPTVEGAVRLADAAVPGLRAFLRADAIDAGVNPLEQLRVEQSGPPRGAILNTHAKLYILALTFMIVAAVCGGLLLLSGRIRRGWRLASARAKSTVISLPGQRGRRFFVDARLFRWTAFRPRASLAANDDWPHTTRALPWMIALFLVVIWLLPFDVFQYGQSSSPVNLTLDRLILPLVFIAWALALAVGGRVAPRLRWTTVHTGVLTFTASACLSLVIGAHYLNGTLLLDQGVKRLALLVAFVTFFLLVASSVRRSEVPAFLRYTLVLAVIAGVGTLVEYRFKYNVFYDLAQRLLVGSHTSQATTGVLDVGLVRGPADAPLEAVGMFTLALPIALLGLVEATRWRPRLWYGTAVVVLIAASLSTDVRSGLLGPLAVIIAIGYFKRRRLIRLAPLGLILIGAVKFLAPGALSGVAGQLAPSAYGANEVADRVLRYDAIRPDAWLHLIFGQGFGTYSIRVLDNEFLGRLLEQGVLGVAAYVLMFLCVIVAATGPIRRHEPVTAHVGQVAVAATCGVLLLSATFDWLGFLHGPYIFLSLAGLLAAATLPPEQAHQSTLVDPGAPRLQPILEKSWSS